MSSLKEDALKYHSKGRPGKIAVIPTKPTNTKRDLSLAYSPGVAEPCIAIAENKEDVYKYTAKGNLVAVISNGTAVLGLGDIGPEASKPVMEGKGVLFKIFADIDVFDIEIDTKDTEAFIQTVKNIAVTFGGINLEDTFVAGYGNRKRLTMHYNTNLSVLKYRDYDFVKYWNKFKRVHLAVSCDGIGEVGEYQRIGFNHNTFVKNLTELKKHAVPLATTEPQDGISYSFQYTTTIYNIEHIFDFIDFMMNNKFIDKEDCISFYYAWGPKYVTLNNMNESDKERITKLFTEKIKTLSSEKTKNEITALINYMNSPSNCEPTYVGELTRKLDVLNDTDYKTITSIKI